MSAAPVAERLASQLLSGTRPRDPVAVAERLLAVQAQDLRGARLAIRARTKGLTVTDVDRALTEDRALVVTWLNRGTLHLVRTEDYWWLHALTTPQLATGNARRLGQEGVSPRDAERAVAVIERALEDGPQTRRQLRDRINGTRVPTNGQALIHLLLLASLRGICVGGPMVGKEQAYVLVRDWIGEPQEIDRPAALAMLARRFLAGHGPADDRDLSRWAGVPLRDARAGLTAIAAETHERRDGLLTVGRRTARPSLPPPRLLGSFEPVLLGWVSRTPIVGQYLSIVTDNGLFRPFALVEGRAVAIWRLTDGEVRLEPFTPLKRAVAAALDADAADVIRSLRGATG
ncbi:MAG: winged helix DNA-binding domain-containing protein [Actinomycetota bacterium]